MNIELARKVQAKLKQRPRQFNMSWWTSQHLWNAKLPISHCGTACCLAGWIIAEAHKKKPSEVSFLMKGNNYAVEAMELLGITEETAIKLFYWPKEFASEAHRITQAMLNTQSRKKLMKLQREYSNLGIAVLEYFIQKAERGEVV